MSAIAGIYRLDHREVDPLMVWRMVGAMPHRGPDGQHVWSDGSVGFGHGMLHTTPESLHERLPFTNEAGTLTITADARVDNRDELIAKLELVPRAKPVADSELILLAYEAWGAACLDELVGDFAFAIWDERKQMLFCARDQFGVRPLYYHHREGEHFAFGTEIKALLPVPEVPERINEVRVADYLVCNEEDAEITLYEGILSLPGAHALEVGPEGLRMWRYYTLAPAQDVGGLSREEYERRFRDLFTEAVRCRIRSAFPVGSQLSGGLDSSAVTCIARRLLAEEERPPLHTLSLVFDRVEECDERPYIEAVVSQGEVVSHFIPGDAYGPLSNLEELYAGLDDRLVGGNQRTVWAMLEVAEQAGLRIVLDGYDGDTTIGHGYQHLWKLAERGEWERFAKEVEMLVRRFSVSDHAQPFEKTASTTTALFNAYGLPPIEAQAEQGRWFRFARSIAATHRLFGVSRSALLRRYWRKLVVPQWIHRRRAASRREGRLLDEGTKLVDPGFASRVNLRARLDGFRLRSAAYKTTGFLGEREQQQEVLSSPRRQEALSTMNHVGAMFGLEVRHPFMDRRLIEFCLALPPELSLHEGWTRYILRHALRDVLPEAVHQRAGKTDMMANFSRGLFELDGEFLRRRVADLGVLGQYVDRERVAHLYKTAEDTKASESSLARTFLTRTVTLATLLDRKFGGSAGVEAVIQRAEDDRTVA